ncbi:replicative DNA helicase [Ligilactobacillus ruminis]|uniref:Replicative DNA helicase n=2 Tax=Ligilactobacillus ruminis TaxID=1623 RepID=G2SPJ5_LIGR2|nr:replicative DNA helicase [Ligilactobacillus ruminis]AEN77349.1 Replicative DNA helicase [Ligilactobacillus ruminis ATCC 27782]MCF2544102.1 replicative DNA helicase [Ligilactobacillus ruminis]MCR5749037.1 replicative DNA helicase [Lactobacillus sp.]SFG33242.1 replicative DNA helicase [Ligilactobacillus ruminis DSM 20403 = NBRC 102161]
MDNDLLAGNMPPQDISAEKAILGAIFLNPEALADVMEQVEPDDFYSRQHQILFQSMIELNDADQPIDVLTMKSSLETKNQLDDAGGVAYLAELANSVPSARNAAYYAKIVSAKSRLRQLIRTSTDIIALAQKQDDDVENILDEAERQIMDVSERRNKAGFKPIREVVDEVYNHLYDLSNNKSDITGLSTGYDKLDKMISGLQPDNLIILAARPAVGKTAFVLNVAENVAIDSDVPVAIFSLEMSAESLVNRMLCARGPIKADNLRDGNLNDDDWHKLYAATDALARTKLYIDDTPGIKMAEIRAKCRRLDKETGGLGLIVIDYLQLIEGSNKESRQQEVSEISRQLKKLSKELSVPVIALSQLSRGVEQRQDKRPVLSDIRESGSIEQDADIVAFLYRDDYYEREEGEEDSGDVKSGQQNENDAGEVELIIEKNRAGARGTVHLVFLKAFNKFTSIETRENPGPI